ncbi:MAG: dienelactone hydrolase family protein [Chloroflexota bacterium]
MHESRLIQHRITSGYIKIIVDDHELPAYWSHPEIGGTFPGLVLLHEWWGLTPQMRTQVRRFAALGFYVIAPDLFNGKVAGDADAALGLQQQLGEAGPPLVNATINALENHHRVNGKMGIVGWHMGGKLALHAAMHRSDLHAVVAFYARPDDYLTLMPADETPILAFYGENDQTASPEMIHRVRVALAKASAKNKVIVYPGTTTGFFNEDLPTYRIQAASDAWFRTLDFLCVHLDIQAPGKTAHQVI